MAKAVEMTLVDKLIFLVPDDTTVDEGNIQELFQEYGQLLQQWLDARGGSKFFVRSWRYAEVPRHPEA
jgi:hypothetical protein